MPTASLFLPYWCTAAVLGLPFAGFLLLTGVGRRGASVWAPAVTGLGLLLSVGLAITLPDEPVALQTTWAGLSGKPFFLTFRCDALATLMLLVVHSVALLVQLYSIAYLHDEPKLRRYFSYLQLFVGAMLGIVLAGNLLVMYAFWELVGLASYLLIGFYAERASATKAAKKAFIMNRVGDIGFLVGIFFTYYVFGTLDFTELSQQAGSIEPPTMLGLCLFMGCVGKSAQFPLLTWLPDAMEGPTPVSALLHAATMVAAGIFLLARVHPLLAPNALAIVALVGTVTTLWGGFSAMYQTDIKKVLAFSTVSQLGLMVVGMGTGNVNGAMFHLFTHAFFKAGLFLSAGAIIHAVHTQDMRQMGSLRQHLPVTFAAYTLCAASLIGLPFFSGFLSKETLLGGAFDWAGQGDVVAYFIPGLLLFSSALTAFYMVRQWRMVFFGRFHNTSLLPDQLHEPDWLMRFPILLLAGLSVWVWFSLNPVSAHTSWFFRLFPITEGVVYWWLAPASMLLVGLGSWLGFVLPEPHSNRAVVRLSQEYGLLDVAYQHLIIRPTVKLANLLNRTDQRAVDGVVNGLGISIVVLAHLSRTTDRLGIDGIVNGLARTARGLGGLARSVQNGRVQSYITVAVVGLLLILWWVL